VLTARHACSAVACASPRSRARSRSRRACTAGSGPPLEAPRPAPPRTPCTGVTAIGSSSIPPRRRILAPLGLTAPETLPHDSERAPRPAPRRPATGRLHRRTGRRLLAQNLTPIAIWMIRTPLRGSSDNRFNGARRANVVPARPSQRLIGSERGSGTDSSRSPIMSGAG
jgi:hypothetical protein